MNQVSKNIHPKYSVRLPSKQCSKVIMVLKAKNASNREKRVKSGDEKKRCQNPVWLPEWSESAPSLEATELRVVAEAGEFFCVPWPELVCEDGLLLLY